MKFEHLIQAMTEAHQALQHQARRTVDASLTIRNWLFGYYIVEFEQSGEDRAEYGRNLIEQSARRLKSVGIKGMSSTNLKLCRQLYLAYPQIRQSVTDQSWQGMKIFLHASQTRLTKAKFPTLPTQQLLQYLTVSFIRTLAN